MGIAIPQVVTSDRASGALVVDGSLKFDQSQSQHLIRTFGAGNRRTWTHSSWVKQGDFGRKKSFFMVGPSSGLSNTNYLSLDFDDNDNLRYAAGGENFKVTTAKFRDTGWYHVVWACDTTQAAAVDRTKIYVNGELITAYGTSSSNPSRYDQLAYNENTVVHRIGTSTPYNGDREWNDAMSQVYFIDGAALGPENFGYTDPLTNTWRPKKFSAFNNPNNGTTWTSSISGTEESGWVKSQTFDGTGASSRASNGNSLTFTPSSAIPIKTSLRINARRYGSGSSQMTVNGTNYTSLLSATKAYVTIPESTITSIVWSNVNGNSDSVDITTIEVDGFPLLDGAGDNSFYLPFDGNSPIVEDKSGNGNNFTPKGFGGSNSLDKATGAKPILNTDGGGNVARPGVFGSEVGAQYTTTSATNSGGKYVFENEGTQPTFSFIRGATYTFDYNASTGHPLRFATAADAAGSTQYTDGTNTSVSNVISFTVPHNAPNTLYYYCTNHSGMGNSISVTTDETKADPYAWKCVLALPLVGGIDDVSDQINCASTAKAATNYGSTDSYVISNFYGRSRKFDGNNDNINYAANADLGFDGDFTIECFCTPGTTGNDSNAIIASKAYYNANYNWYLKFNDQDGGHMVWFSYNGTGAGENLNINNLGTTNANRIHHIAVTRESNVMRFYVDGVKVGNTTFSRNYNDGATNGLTLARQPSGNSANSAHGWYDGYISDLRIYKGVAKYNGATTGVQYFIPASTNPDILPDSPSGVAVKTQLTKIAEGSVAFDGSGDYLTLADSTDFDHQSTFTWECFLYINAYDSSGTLIAEQRGSSTGMQWYIGTNGTMNFNRNGSTGLVNGGAFALKRWQHVAISHDGTKIRMFIDGKNVAEATTSSVPDNVSEPLNIGRVSGSTAFDLNGFVSNLRFVNGTALYTANFTPPTRELTNVTNTKLLCCQSTVEPGGAAVAPNVSGINNGTQWSNYLTGAGGFQSSYPATNAFNGTVSASETSRSTNNGETQTFAPPSGISYSSKVEVWTYYTGNVSLNGGSNVAVSDDQDWRTIATGSGTLNTLDFICNSGNSMYLAGIRIDNTIILVDPVSPEGNAAATNFNPFNTDINTVRGQETGYCTLNPLSIGPGTAPTLSDGNLRVKANTSIFSRTNGDTFATSGKFYAEVTKLAGQTSDDVIGIGARTYQPLYSTNPYIGRTSDSYGFYGDGRKINNNSFTSYSSSWGQLGDVMGLLMDLDAGTISLSINNINQGVAFSGIDVSLGWTFCVSPYNNQEYSLNFGQKPFKFPPPPGFQSLNAASARPETVIARPDQYFGMNLWTGNGQSSLVVGGGNYIITPNPKDNGSYANREPYDMFDGSTSTYWQAAASGDRYQLMTFPTPKTGSKIELSVLASNGWDGFEINGTVPGNLPSAGSQSWYDITSHTGGSLSSIRIAYTSGNHTQLVYALRIDDTIVTNQVLGTDPYQFSPDLVWVKSRDATHYHSWIDTIRGGTKIIFSNADNAEETQSGAITSFNSNGFSVSNWGAVNTNINSYVAWAWKAGGNKNTFNVDDVGYASAAAAGLTGGSITPTGASVGTKQGFSIIKYTGTGSNASVSHGLQNIPQFIIVKDLDSTSGWWAVYHHSIGNTHALYLNDTQSKVDNSFWNDTTPTSSVFTIGANANTNSSNDFISYLWHDVPGLQKFGKYTGNNNADGPFIELGFRPSIIIIKRSDGGTENWTLWDASRNPENVMGRQLYPNSTAAEADAGTNASYGILDFVSNGVKIRGSHTSFNSDGGTFIYAAWAEAPSFNLYGAQSNAR